MSDELVLYHNPMSRGRITHWMMEEVGVPYRLELLDFEKGEHKRADYLALNPMGKIPTLVHRGTVITEAAAICAYLADAFPQAGLAPAASDPTRGSYYRWLFFGAGCIEPALLEKAFDRPPVERKSAVGFGSYEDVMQTLEQALSKAKPYLLGERFSAADVYVGSQISWGLMIKSIEPRPAFTEYLARLDARPAAKRSDEQNAALIAKLQATRASK